LTENTYPQYIRKLQQVRPKHLQAYPSAGVMLADLVLKHGDVGRLHFDVILLGSENFYPWQEERIRRAFPQSRLHCWYGQAEQASLAAWCENAQTYHVWPFYGVTEILDEDGGEVEPGQPGEVVATSFWNVATPFIRYRTMDRAVKGGHGCEECGRRFQVIDAIEGRLQEFVISASGRRVSMTAVNMHTDIFDNVYQFQFHQDTPGVVTLNLVRKDGYTEDDSARIHAAVSHKLGEDTELHLAFVDAIARTPSGKLRFLVQELEVGD
jgi:phenylacetate-CoA ligase